MNDGVGAFLFGDLHQALGNDGPGVGCAQQVLFIHGAGFEAGHDVFIDVFVRKIEHIKLGRTGLKRLLLQTLQLVGLADIAGDCDDLAVVVILLEPGDDDGCIQTARIGKYDFLDVLLLHGNASLYKLL